MEHLFHVFGARKQAKVRAVHAAGELQVLGLDVGQLEQSTTAAAVKYVELVSRAVYGERPAIVGSIHVQVCHRHAFVATVDAHVTGQLGEVPGVAANIDVVLPRALQC